jgi:HPt (histidine-containing phosphotransfer) domain-containing protein
MINTNTLQSLLGDDTLVRKYLLRFTTDMPDLLRQIRSAYADQRWEEISIHAHTYKSQMQYIDDTNATHLAAELERKCADAAPAALLIGDLITKLDIRLIATLEEIRQITG